MSRSGEEATLLSPSIIMLVDVENGCHKYVEGVRAYTSDVLVVLVVPKTYEVAKFKGILPGVLADETVTAPASGYYYSDPPKQPLQPSASWVWIVRAASDKAQAADVCMTSLSRFLVKKLSNDGGWGGPSKVALFQAAVEEENIVFESCFPDKTPPARDFQVLIPRGRTTALVVAAVADARYAALIDELRALNDSRKDRSWVKSANIQLNPSPSLLGKLVRQPISGGTVHVHARVLAPTTYQAPELLCCHFCKMLFGVADASSYSSYSSSDEAARLRSSYEAHLKLVHSACESCGQPVRSSADLASHVRSHPCTHATCSRRGYQLYCSQALDDHYAREHKAADELKQKQEQEAREAQERARVAQERAHEAYEQQRIKERQELQQRADQHPLYCPYVHCKRFNKQFAAKQARNQHLKSCMYNVHDIK